MHSKLPHEKATKSVDERHHGDEFLVADLLVAVGVGHLDHVPHLLRGELLAQGAHGVPQLAGRDEAVAVPVVVVESTFIGLA